MYLLDTMVLSETGKRNPDPRVVAWRQSVAEASLYVSALTFGEIEAGIEMKRASDPLFSARLHLWSREARAAFAERTLPVTVEVALRWGDLYVRLKRRDMDLLIAATALEHGMIVVTRNVRHFEPTGVRLLNPYDS